MTREEEFAFDKIKLDIALMTARTIRMHRDREMDRINKKRSERLLQILDKAQ